MILEKDMMGDIIEMKILNLGCGEKVIDGAINVDIKPFKGVNKIMDLNKEIWSFDSDFFDEIYAYHVIEHLDDFDATMGKLHRILKDDGEIHIKIPHHSSQGTHTPYHRMSLNAFVFDNVPELKIVKKKLHFHKGFYVYNHIIELLANRFLEVYENTGLKALFPAVELEVVLVKR